jgi:hypothetical protein
MDIYSEVKSKLDTFVKDDTSETISETVMYLTDQYILELSENNKCIKKLLNDITLLKEEICRERLKVAALEKEIGETIGKRNFRTYMITVKNREPTDYEWSKFFQDFLNGLDFSKAVYSWIDNNIF